MSFSFKVCFIGLLFLAGSCSPVRQRLNSAEECMMEHPDSALSILNRIHPETIHSPGNKARYAVLMTMARQKNFIFETNDSTILRAYKYFNRWGSRRNRMISDYYLGVVRHNAGNTLEAVPVFIQAEPLAVALHDTHHLGLIYRHLCEIYTTNYDYVRALEYGKKAFAAFNEKKEKIYADYMAAYIAGMYIGQHNWKEARFWADSLLRDTTINNSLFCQATRYKAEAHLWEADYGVADSCYQRLLKRGVPLLERDLFGFAMVKEFSGDSETADSLLKQIETTVETPLDSATFYDYQHNVYDLRGDIPAAYDALIEALKVQNRVVRQQLEQSVSYSMATAFQTQAELERTRLRLTRIAWLCSGLALLLCVVGLWRLLRRKNRQLLEEMAMVEGIETDLEILRKRDQKTASVLDSFVSDKIRLLQNIAETYFNWEEESIRKREKRFGKMTPNEMLISFQRQLGELRKDKGFIQTLESSLNLSDNGVMDRLRLDFPKWDDEDFTLLTLFFSGFSAKSIGFFLRMSDPAVRMRKTRFKQAFEQLPDGHGKEYLVRLGY